MKCRIHGAVLSLLCLIFIFTPVLAASAAGGSNDAVTVSSIDFKDNSVVFPDFGVSVHLNLLRVSPSDFSYVTVYDILTAFLEDQNWTCTFSEDGGYITGGKITGAGKEFIISAQNRLQYAIIRTSDGVKTCLKYGDIPRHDSIQITSDLLIDTEIYFMYGSAEINLQSVESRADKFDPEYSDLYKKPVWTGSNKVVEIIKSINDGTYEEGVLIDSLQSYNDSGVLDGQLAVSRSFYTHESDISNADEYIGNGFLGISCDPDNGTWTHDSRVYSYTPIFRNSSTGAFTLRFKRETDSTAVGVQVPSVFYNSYYDCVLYRKLNTSLNETCCYFGCLDEDNNCYFYCYGYPERTVPKWYARKFYYQLEGGTSSYFRAHPNNPYTCAKTDFLPDFNGYKGDGKTDVIVKSILDGTYEDGVEINSKYAYGIMQTELKKKRTFYTGYTGRIYSSLIEPYDICSGYLGFVGSEGTYIPDVALQEYKPFYAGTDKMFWIVKCTDSASGLQGYRSNVFFYNSFFDSITLKYTASDGTEFYGCIFYDEDNSRYNWISFNIADDSGYLLNSISSIYYQLEDGTSSYFCMRPESSFSASSDSCNLENKLDEIISSIRNGTYEKGNRIDTIYAYNQIETGLRVERTYYWSGADIYSDSIFRIEECTGLKAEACSESRKVFLRNNSVCFALNFHMEERGACSYSSRVIYYNPVYDSVFIKKPSSTVLGFMDEKNSCYILLYLPDDQSKKIEIFKHYYLLEDGTTSYYVMHPPEKIFQITPENYQEHMDILQPFFEKRKFHVAKGEPLAEDVTSFYEYYDPDIPPVTREKAAVSVNEDRFEVYLGNRYVYLRSTATSFGSLTYDTDTGILSASAEEKRYDLFLDGFSYCIQENDLRTGSVVKEQYYYLQEDGVTSSFYAEYPEHPTRPGAPVEPDPDLTESQGLLLASTATVLSFSMLILNRIAQDPILSFWLACSLVGIGIYVVYRIRNAID